MPETLLLFTIVALNISLTSGEANSFVFFVQVLNLYRITAFDSIPLSWGEYMATLIYQFIFSFADLDFFNLDQLSFCLWQGATVLDMLAMKYATVIFGLLLVIVLSCVMEHCICRCRVKGDHAQVESSDRRLSLPPLRDESESNEVHTQFEPSHRKDGDGRSQNSVVNGLCAFFIMTYAQSASVSFAILSASALRTGGGQSNATVVLLQGDTVFFSKEHLHYALIATLVGLVILLIPLFFILEPVYHLLKNHYVLCH